MNLISDCMKISNRANKPPAALTARTKRMTADHSWRKRRGFFFGGAACCTLLDDTWNTGMTLFLCDTIFIHLYDYLIISILGKVQPCHPSLRSGSLFLSRQTLRCAQCDRVYLLQLSRTI